MENEFTTIRDECMKWQDRRILFHQIALTLVTVYVGYLFSKDAKDIQISWQLASLLPLLILTMTMHITRLFELFQIRAATYLAVFYDCPWEQNIDKLSFSKRLWRLGYNKSMAIVYILIACFSTFSLIQKYPYSHNLWETLIFSFCLLVFFSIFLTLFTFNTKKEKEKLFNQWAAIKDKSDNA